MESLLAFAIGVSFSASFVTLAYLSHGWQQAKQKPAVPLNNVRIGARLAYGIANVVNVYFGNTIQSAATVGALLGEAFSLVGRYQLGLPKLLFGMTDATAWRVHAIAPVLYAGIFVLLVRNLNTLFI
jgi:hypothetical protein